MTYAIFWLRPNVMRICSPAGWRSSPVDHGKGRHRYWFAQSDSCHLSGLARVNQHAPERCDRGRGSSNAAKTA